jgi:hypothetical protein
VLGTLRADVVAIEDKGNGLYAAHLLISGTIVDAKNTEYTFDRVKSVMGFSGGIGPKQTLSEQRQAEVHEITMITRFGEGI